MQCPECRSETPGSLGRCTRCDAVLPQAEEVSPWSSAPAGNDPWPPEPWQPEPVRQGWQAGPPQEDRPWPEQPPEPQWGGQQPERPWGGPPERPWSDGPQERPWSDGPQERPWAEQPDDRPWAEQQQPPQQQRPWGEQPGEARPWDADPGPQQWGGGQQQPWSSGPEQQAPPRNDGEQWLPDEAPRWRGPLIAGLIAALLTAAIVVGYVFWNKEDDKTAPVSRPGTSQPPVQAPGEEKDAPAEGDPQTQAEAVNALLDDMSASRKKLSGITYTCANKDTDISTFETAIEERQGQLTTAGELSLSAFDDGEAVKQALVDALQASIDSNQEALTWLSEENGCGQDAAARLKDVTDKATDTKRAFLDLWNPLATEQGLQTWTRENI